MRDRVAVLFENTRASVDIEDLAKVALALLIIWLALEVLEELFAFALGLLKPLLTLVVVGLIVLWLLDRL